MITESVRTAVAGALQAGHFFVARRRRLRVEHVAGELARWELFRGRLVDPAQTREEVEFDSWHVYLDSDEERSTAPLISLRWQRASGQLHVVRQILTHGFEAYEDEPGVILTRPAQKWLPELIGTLASDLAPGDWQAELEQLMFLAVVGTSRLPITSLESPLPAFSLGELAYLPTMHGQQVWDDPRELLAVVLGSEMALVYQTTALEIAVRASSAAELVALADVILEKLAGPDRQARIRQLCSAVFNGVALSPYTAFVDRWIALLGLLGESERFGRPAVVDIATRMLLNLCRHLTAFDLNLFHNSGANYPDALLLDALLKTLAEWMRASPELFLDNVGDATTTARAKRWRRRALPTAFLIRKQYEGHRVPDRPTSMGENLRVLPREFAPVPEEQISQVARRERRLFEHDPCESLLSGSAFEILRASVADWVQPDAIVELGTALFLDRPLGACKDPGDVDRTPLVSYRAVSRIIADRRLSQMHAWGWIADAQRDAFKLAVRNVKLPGIKATSLVVRQRPGVVSVMDAVAAAPDFVLQHCTRRSLDALLAHYDWSPLERQAPATFAWLTTSRDVLLVPHAPPDCLASENTLQFYAGDVLRLELAYDPTLRGEQAYGWRGGIELPARLRVRRCGDVPAAEVWIELRGLA